MKKVCISKDWYICPFTETEYTKTDLPNDFIIKTPRVKNAPGGASNGFFIGGIAKYVKYLTANDERIILDIDGAYMGSCIYFNEYHLTTHPSGYTPILVDLSEHFKRGKTNKLKIITNALQPSTRWYTGGGIYRDVFLWTGGNICIQPRDVFITTPTLSDVCSQIKITSDKNETVTVTATIYNKEGATVKTSSRDITLAEGKTDCEFCFNIENAENWCPENPYLYTMRTDITKDGKLLDSDTRRFGIRTVSADAKRGLLLNGKSIKLRGGCIHHDHGAIGTADFPAACKRKLKLLQNAGFNAIRTAHNTPSLSLLEMCDEMGIIVMDEFFDSWGEFKGSGAAYHIWFFDHWYKDIEAAVLRDRDHPCVISYSIGNEVPEAIGKSEGAKWSKLLADKTREIDGTRLISASTYNSGNIFPEAIDPPDYKEDFIKKYHTSEHPEANKNMRPNWTGRTKGFFEPLDICGYNYLYTQYEADHSVFPDRVIWGSETHALTFYDSWKKTLELPYVIGDFTWTAYDNMGEVGTGRSVWARDGVIAHISLAGYPWRTCYQGDFDLCGYRRPQSYFREAIWTGKSELKIFTTHPEHYGEGFTGTGWHWYDVLDSWTFDEKYIGKPVKCEVYTLSDEIEWFLNGKSVGKSVPIKAIATMDIPYEPGEVSVIAYKNGSECGRSYLKTSKEPSIVKITPETIEITADGRDLCYFDIEITDKDSVRIADLKTKLTCLVDGGELMAIFSGDPKNEDQYGSQICHTFEGRALAIVRTTTPGKVTIHVKADGIEKAGSAQIDAI